MLNVVDYEYYTEVFGGTSIPETSFLKYSNIATSKVNYFTFNKITDYVDNIKMSICEIADLFYQNDELKTNLTSDDKFKSSETVGPHSVSYESNKSYKKELILTDDELDSKAFNICLQWFGYTGLLYRGYNVSR